MHNHDWLYVIAVFLLGLATGVNHLAVAVPLVLGAGACVIAVNYLNRRDHHDLES